MKLAPLFLCAAALFAQTPSTPSVQKVFYFTTVPTQQAKSDLATALRTVAQVQQALFDNDAKSLTVSAPADQIGLAEWLFHELDQTAAPVQNTVIHEYPLAAQAPNGVETAKVVYLANATTQQFITDLVTGIRTIADVPRLFPYNTLRVIVMRGTVDRMAAAEWLIHEFDRPAGSYQAPAVHQYSATLTLSPRETNVLKVFYMAHAEKLQAMTDLITAMRTVADATRMFPFAGANAIMVAATADRVAAAEWMFHDLDQPAAAAFTTSAYGVPLSYSTRMDDMALKVFHLSPAMTQQDMTELIASIRKTTGIQRVFPLAIPRAIALSGIPASVAQAEALAKLKDQPAAQ